MGRLQQAKTSKFDSTNEVEHQQTKIAAPANGGNSFLLAEVETRKQAYTTGPGLAVGEAHRTLPEALPVGASVVVGAV